MRFIDGGVRRVLVGKEVGIVFGLLLAGSVLIQASFLPTYLAVLLASGIRNIYFAWLGNGVLFWAVALFGLYLQAVVVTTSYLVLRSVGNALRGPAADDPSA